MIRAKMVLSVADLNGVEQQVKIDSWNREEMHKALDEFFDLYRDIIGMPHPGDKEALELEEAMANEENEMVIIRYGEGTEMFRLHEAGKTPSEIIKMLVDSGKCRPYWIGKEKSVVS